jgi:hypothetical protein
MVIQDWGEFWIFDFVMGEFGSWDRNEVSGTRNEVRMEVWKCGGLEEVSKRNLKA